MPLWNLTERLSTSTYRLYHLPVASDPSGGAALPLVPSDRYEIEEMEVDGMPRLQVTVAATADGFPAVDGLPAPVIRLHAMGNGRFSYRPQVGSLRDCLLLDLAPIWLNAAVLAKWLERWIEADCIPRTVIYDNIDPDALRARLEAAPINADATITDRLSFPRAVRREGDSKAWFIDRFMAAEPGVAGMTAWQGACLGQMGPVMGSASRRLGLTVRYQGHTDAAPRPMMPRELFNLLFGIDSAEFANHPLLRAIQQLGQSDTTQPVTRRMLLRPPLRTHARVMWEANKELPDTARWSLTGRLDSTKLLNTVDGFDRSKHYGISPAAPKGVFKCQVFGFEMLLRSGFRVRMHRTPEAGGWRVYYYIANRIVREARDADLSGSGPVVIGTEGETPWGRRWDLVLRSLPDDLQAAEINRLIDEEGRAFYIAMEFQGVTRKAAGHFVLLEHVQETVPATWPWPDLPYPIVWEDAGDPAKGTRSGLQWILASVYEAPGTGLRQNTGILVPGWDPWFRFFKSPHLGEGSTNNDLLLIEALPGPDPHTQDGIRALCSIHQKQT